MSYESRLLSFGMSSFSNVPKRLPDILHMCIHQLESIGPTIQRRQKRQSSSINYPLDPLPLQHAARLQQQLDGRVVLPLEHQPLDARRDLGHAVDLVQQLDDVAQRDAAVPLLLELLVAGRQQPPRLAQVALEAGHLGGALAEETQDLGGSTEIDLDLSFRDLCSSCIVGKTQERMGQN